MHRLALPNNGQLRAMKVHGIYELMLTLIINIFTRFDKNYLTFKT